MEKEGMEKFFDTEISKHEIFVSDLVIDEISKASKEECKMLKNVIKKYKCKFLTVTEECHNLAEKYIKAGIILSKYKNDALHIAIAIINNIDVVVSWNLEHIVKLKTIVGVNEINKKLNYPNILINTPEEVIE